MSEVIAELNYHYDGYKKNQTFNPPAELMQKVAALFFEQFGRKLRTYCSDCLIADIQSLLIKCQQ